VTPGDLEERFREATTDIEVAPVRWSRVAQRIRRRRLLMAVALLATSATVAVALLAGKAAVDPTFHPPFIARQAALSVRFAEPHAARGHVRLGTYLAGTIAAARSSQAQLHEEGFVFSVSVELKGYRGTPMSVFWSVLNATTHVPVPVSLRPDLPAIRPTEQTYTRRLRVWVPYPPSSGKYVVRFRLTRGSTTVARSDSAPFVALRPDSFAQYRSPSFSARLPKSWHVVADFVPEPTSRHVTKAVGPGGMSVLIDTTSGFHGDPAHSAQELEKPNLENRAYKRVVFQRETLGTGPAFEWSYRLGHLSYTDILFDRGGDGYAVLAVGPVERFSESRAVARAVARSVKRR
jgi:hypothetical protein